MIIRFRLDVVKIFLREKLDERFAPAEADLECEQSVRPQMRRRLLNQCANEFIAAFAAKKRGLWIV